MMQDWFRKAKLGIFIHWGIYAVKGISESWSFGLGEISYDDYMEQLNGFTASNYDPKKWAKLFKKSGAKYVVLTSKHHDGVALFDSKYSDLNVVKKTPAARDLIGPYCEALREEDLKVGIYYTNTDWSNMDNMSVILDMEKEEIEKTKSSKFSSVKVWGEVIPREEKKETVEIIPEKKEAWDRFIEFYRNQMREVLTNYGDVDLLWLDVMLGRKGYSWDCENTKKMIESINPKTVVNSRLGDYGDYETPELYVPLAPLASEWELCTTFNDSWGFRHNDNNYKTIRQLVRMFCECISKGGNMLISVGPNAAGEIAPESEKLMLEMGEWTSKYEEAIYPTNKGIDTTYFAGGTTLTEDKKTLYLFVYDIPQDKIMLNGIRNKIKKITSLASNNELTHTITGGAGWLRMPGCIWIDVPKQDTDPVCTVLKIEFEEEIDLVDIKRVVKSEGGI